MEQTKQNHLISVDSETGFYWNGERVLRHKALISAVIEQETTKKYVGHGRVLRHFSAIKMPLATGK